MLYVCIYMYLHVYTVSSGVKKNANYASENGSICIMKYKHVHVHGT